jgi:hypothetical protein
LVASSSPLLIRRWLLHPSRSSAGAVHRHPEWMGMEIRLRRSSSTKCRLTKPPCLFQP